MIQRKRLIEILEDRVDCDTENYNKLIYALIDCAVVADNYLRWTKADGGCDNEAVTHLFAITNSLREIGELLREKDDTKRF